MSDKVASKICIVFDLDGTLVHTAPALANAGNELLMDLKLPPVSVSTYSNFIGGGIPKQVEKLLKFSNANVENSLDEYVLKFKNYYYKDPLNGTFIYPGVEMALKKLKKIYKNLVICTQKNEKPARFILRSFNILEYFSGFSFGDSLDVLKPDPRMVHHAVKDFNPDRVLYVGDSLTDAKTAKNSNSTFLLFTEGYRTVSVEDLNPDYYFSDFSKLPAIIKAIEKI